MLVNVPGGFDYFMSPYWHKVVLISDYVVD